jgi:nucleoside-diphosphate-sugar epimerase
MTGSCPEGRGSLVVLGASGWMGRSVTRAARASGWHVVQAGRTPAPGVHPVDLDLVSLRSLISATRPAAIVNCIGLARGTSDDLLAANVEVVRTLVEIAGHEPFKLVQIGSAAEYGDPESTLPLSEDAPLRPTSAYGHSKAEATQLILDAGTEAAVGRVFNVAGPQSPPGSLLADLVARVRDADDEAVVIGNPRMLRDWITLNFAGEALTALCDPGLPATVVNICSGLATSHGDLAAALANVMGRSLLVRDGGQKGVAAVIGNPSRLAALTGLAEGLAPLDLARASFAEQSAHTDDDR